MMKYIKVRNPRSTNKEKFIDCDVVFPSISNLPTPFTATPDDSSEHGREIYEKALNGQFGTVILSPNETEYSWDGNEYIKKKVSDTTYANDEAKSSLLSEASLKISILNDAVELDEATDEEVKYLIAWKKYRVLVNRVDTEQTDIIWPEKPKA